MQRETFGFPRSDDEYLLTSVQVQLCVLRKRRISFFAIQVWLKKEEMKDGEEQK